MVAQAGIKVICHGKITDLFDLVNSYIFSGKKSWNLPPDKQRSKLREGGGEAQGLVRVPFL